MNPLFTVIALSACLLWLAGCDKTTPVPPTPIVSQPVPIESAATADADVHPGVPPAETVFAPGGSPQVKPELTDTDGVRRPAQEPEAEPMQKPMPGQNNDHSAPLSPAQ